MQGPSKLKLALALLLTLGFGAGCAEERDPINRVQADALDKTFFVADLNDDLDNPVFYSKAFVIDQSAGQSAISVGLYSGTDRVKWEITEDYLLARKGYQIVQGQDQHGLPNGEPNGTVVGRFRIASHFDIKRSYNPQTGEELNIVEENTSDRPWYQRRYMRVDWSTNDVNDPMFGEIFLGKIFGDVSVLPLTYTVTDPENEDAPHFEADDGYFDVTNRFYVEPGTTDKWGLKLPTCALVGLYTGTTSNDCNGQEATLRHSFWKVQPDHDFEPMENTQRKFDVIANFGGAGDSLQPGFAGGTTQCWDPQYAYTEACFHQYMVKLNFWAKSHSAIACTSDEDADRDGTADQCAAYVGAKGAQCDVVNKKCTLPLRDRPIKSVGYWMNKETPLELLDPLDQSGKPQAPLDATGIPLERGPMEDVVKSWNQLLLAAFAYGREAECRRTGGDRQSCHELFFETEDGRDKTQMISFGGWGIATPKALPQDAPAALVSCHAPVRAYDDHGVCGKTGEVARNGDQRKNWIYYWPYDSDAPYGGVAGLGQDPETGESHGTTATVMGRSALRAAANYRDYLLYAIGDLSLDDIAQGVPQFMFKKIADNGFSPNSDTGRRARGETIEYANSIQSKAKTEARRQPNTVTDAALRVRNLRALVSAQKKSGYDAVLQAQAQPLWESFARKLQGTRYEAELVDPGWAMSAVGSDPRQPVSSSTLDAASPFRNLDSGRLSLFRAEVSSKLASAGVCFTEDVPRIGSINFQGMSRWYLDKFAELGLDSDIAAGGPRDPDLVKKRAEFIFQDLFRGMAKGIAIHEVGHCLGMRHNFASSFDAPNYMPQYWQLRTNEGQATESCGGGRDPSQPDICMGPRYFDPETVDEQGLAMPDASGRSNGRPGVGYFGNTSVMEYEVDYMSPGIGTYDFDYIKAVYGGVLETYDIDHIDEGGIAEQDQERFLVNMSLQLSELSMLDDDATHYTTLSRNLKVFDPSYCRDATPEELAHGEWRVVHGKICSQSPRDHAFWKDFQSDAEGGTRVPSLYADILNFSYWHTKPDGDGRSRQRWSYRYGETYGTGYMHTNPIDTGADVYEVTVNNSKLYDLTYPLSYFRRGNKEYRYDNIPAAIADRYFERARAYHWILEGNDAYLRQFGELYPAYTKARQEAFYFLARAALAPEPGPMAAGFRPDGSVVYDVEDQTTLLPEFRVALIDGRYVSQEFSNAHGGNWDYLSWIDHAAYNIERGLAMRALLDGRPTLFTISRETYLDGRNVMKNFRVDNALGLDRLLGGMLSDDWTNVGMWAKDMVETGDGGPPFASLQMMNLLDPSPARPAGSFAVFPNVGYKTELATVLFAHLFARMNSDMTLINKMRIYVLGLDFLGAIPDSEQVRFTDPGNGFTYVARRYGPDTINGKTIDAGIGSRMLMQANTLLARAYVVEENAGQPVLDAYGAPKLLSNVPRPEGAVAADALRKYVGLLDASRQIGRLLDGPLDDTTPPGE